MRVFRSLRHPGLAAHCALTIGNFDGVHRGHQAMLALLVSEAAHRGLPATVLTFVAVLHRFLVDVPFLYPFLSGVEILELVAGLHGFAAAEARRRARRAADEAGLGDAATAFTSTYSLGMKKRTALAMALIHEPRVLILDEPTNGLDPRGARDMRDTISRLAAAGRTVLMSTHLLEAAERLCSRVAIIRAGVLQAVGTPAELCARYAAAPEESLEDLFLRATEAAP
jgi:ABC-2 type transport system ATP-binding protein